MRDHVRACGRDILALGGLLLLAACGGGGNGTVAPPPVSVNRLEVIRVPLDPQGVGSPECAQNNAPAVDAQAPFARYPRLNASLRTWRSPFDPGPWPQMRSDKASGFVVSHRTGEGGAMFHVDAAGAKRRLPLPYASIFDVDEAGQVWFMQDGALRRGNLAGEVTTLAAETGATPPSDGPLGSSPLGRVGLIAAGRDKVYLLIEESASGVDPRTYLPSTMVRSWRVLERQSSGTWAVRTLPQVPGLAASDVVSALRVGPGDTLYMLLDQPFWQLLRDPGPPYLGDYQARVSVWRFDSASGWNPLAARNYLMQVGVNSTRGFVYFSYDFDAKDLAIAADGGVFVAGAGGIYQVTAAGGWVKVVSAGGHDPYDLGRDGGLGDAALGLPIQVVVSGSGVNFYDGETCQLRRWEGGHLSTLSGPRIVSANFKLARFVASGMDGSILFGERSRDDSVEYHHFDVSPRLFRANVANPQAVLQRVRSIAPPMREVIRCVYAYHYTADEGCAIQGYGEPFSGWLGAGTKGVIAQLGLGIYSGLADSDPAATKLLSDVTKWPGILDGGAPAAAGGFHVVDDHLYVYATVRTDPPVSTNVYVEPRLYMIDLANGVASPVAGATINSAVFGGARIDLAEVNPVYWAGPLLVRRRSDGAFWLASAKEVWLLQNNGRLRRVAGLAASGASGGDGMGAGASFGFISGMRVLPDDRLVVADRSAHAIRLVDDAGSVATIVGRLNQPGLVAGELPGGLDEPVDILVVGRDLYISTATGGDLLLARGAL